MSKSYIFFRILTIFVKTVHAIEPDETTGSFKIYNAMKTDVVESWTNSSDPRQSYRTKTKEAGGLVCTYKEYDYKSSSSYECSLRLDDRKDATIYEALDVEEVPETVNMDVAVPDLQIFEKKVGPLACRKGIQSTVNDGKKEIHRCIIQ